MNVEGLTNRQLLVKALQQVLRDADNTQLPGFRGGLVSDATLDWPAPRSAKWSGTKGRRAWPS